MTKTVQEVIEEFRNRQKPAKIEELLLRVGDQTLCFKEVVNFKIIGEGRISFDYNDSELKYDKSMRKVITAPHWKHVVCSGTVLLMEGAIGEDV